MKFLISLLLTAVISIWGSLAQADPSALQSLSGEWHQVFSNAGKCDDCRVTVKMNGQNLTVTANNGWSAILQPTSFQGKTFVAGKGSWKPGFGGTYEGKPFFLNLGIVDDRLLIVMTVPSPDGKLRNIKATFEKGSVSKDSI